MKQTSQSFHSSTKNERKIRKNFHFFVSNGNQVNQFVDFISQIILFVAIISVYCSSVKEEAAVNVPKGVEPRAQRDCIKIGNFDGRDFKEHLCPLRWYVAGLQFVGHQSGESAYVISCCQDI